MPQNVIIELGTATLRKLQESPEDEIYVIGGVRVVDPADGDVKERLSKVFSRVGKIVFTQADRDRPKRLAPTGPIYDEIVADGLVVEVLVMVMEEDLSQLILRIAEVRERFEKFLGNADRLFGGLELVADEIGKLEQYSLLARLFISFVDFFASILDPDDILGIDQRKFRLPPEPPPAPVVIPVSFPAQLDNANYDPVSYTVTISNPADVSLIRVTPPELGEALAPPGPLLEPVELPLVPSPPGAVGPAGDEGAGS